MERMKAKVLVGFLMGCLICMLMVLPSFVYADVTIDTAETSMVDLEDRNAEGTTRNAYVTDIGSVTVSDEPGLWANINGWNIANNGNISSNYDEGGHPVSAYSGVYFGDGSNYYSGTVTNYGTIYGYNYGILMGSGTITNHGSIMADDTDTGISIQFYNYGVGTATVTVTNSGTIEAHDGAIDFYSAGAGMVTVINSGTITTAADYGYSIYLASDGALTATIQNNVGGTIYGYYDAVSFDSNGAGTATVTNAGGVIQSSNGKGIGINDVSEAKVTNSGTILAGDQGIYIDDADTATITNNAGGLIQSYGDHGIDISDVVGTVTVNNSGIIQSLDTVDDHDGLYIGNAGTATVTNSGTISSTDGCGVYFWGTGTKNVTNSGTISGGSFGIFIQGSGARTLTNNAEGSISGEVGIGTGVHGYTTIYNYGKIESTEGMDGRAIVLRGSNNEVTLGTGTEITGNIVAVFYDSTNAMILDGHGTLGASQIQNFGTLDKTGAGTWVLTGDMDYTDDGDGGTQTMPITVETGVLALAARDTEIGVTTSHFEQLSGASLGFVVNAMTYAPGEVEVTANTNLTGALTVIDVGVEAETAIFNGGTIVIMPQAGKYASQTTYLSVLDLSDTYVDSYWSQVTSTSAFLSPSLVDQGGEIPTDVYDLVLNRLSFSTGALNSSLSLGYALDGMYEDATGDMRDILDTLIVMSPGEAQTALAQMGGGTHTAFQFMSFYGINKYHGALNNHLGGGSGFAGGLGKGMAANQNSYPPGVQTAIAGGGNTMSDVTPILLAMAGNGGQLASGTNWDLWIDGYFSQGNRRSNDVIAKYKQTLYGALMGLDYRATDNLLIGISAGLSQAEVKFDELMDKGNQDSYQGSVYAYYDGKPWYAEGVLTYAYNSYKMDRFITVGGITRLANSEYKGNEYAGYAEVGYKLDLGGVLEIRPMAAFQAVYLMQDGYTETGAGDLNLIVDSQDTGSYQSYLGLRISKAITMGKFVLTPDARAKWAHEFSSDDHLINAKFSSAGSGSFTVEADRPSRDTAIVGVGLTGRFNKNLSMYIQYDAELNRDYTNHTGMLGLRFSW